MWIDVEALKVAFGGYRRKHFGSRLGPHGRGPAIPAGAGAAQSRVDPFKVLPNAIIALSMVSLPALLLLEILFAYAWLNAGSHGGMRL